MSTSFQCQKCKKQTPETNRFPEPEFLFCIHCGTRHKMVAAIGDYSWAIAENETLQKLEECLEVLFETYEADNPGFSALTNDFIASVDEFVRKAKGE